MRLLSLFAAACVSIASAAPTEDGIYATFDTSKGAFTISLYHEKAPISSANFIGLAEGSLTRWNSANAPINAPFYDGLIFHRVIDGFMIQGGDPLGNGTGGPGYSFPDEVRPDVKHSKKGILSMANSGANTNGSQFFITLAAQPHLNGLHNVFGEVVEGIEVVEAIGKVATGAGDKPVTNVVINSIDITRIGEAALAFNPPPKLLFDSNAELGPHIAVERKDSRSYLIRRSPDLETWTEEALLPDNLEENGAWAVSLAEEFDAIGSLTPRFFDVVEILQYQSTNVNGSKLVVTTAQTGDDYVETLTFNAAFKAKWNDSQREVAVEYKWLDIGAGRTQVVIGATANGSFATYVQYFLDWTDATSGTVYLRDVGSTFVGTATFTFEP